jgi:hypothetical protein
MAMEIEDFDGLISRLMQISGAKNESRLKTVACWVGQFRNKAFLNWDWLFAKLDNRELILDNGKGIYKDEATERQIADYESWKKMINELHGQSNI